LSINWIDVENLSFNSLLLLEEVQLSWFPGWLPEPELGVALKANPAVEWFMRHKCPRIGKWLDGVLEKAGDMASGPAEIRAAEMAVMNSANDLLTYAVDPAAYDTLPFLGWDSGELTSLVDFTGRVVIDVGAGTGRLTFVAAPDARAVFAVEPVANLRSYIREKAKRQGFRNVFPVDGLITEMPFPDGFADVTLGGHVFGDHVEEEHRELGRVTRSGGMIILCPGNNDVDNDCHAFLVSKGFEWSRFEEPEDGTKRKYWKKRGAPSSSADKGLGKHTANQSQEAAERSNRELWDELAPVHLRAYREVAILREGGSTLHEIELEEIGPVDGKTLLHLQCHIGTDTLSWARLGAVVTGVDFSPESIACAKRLQEELGLPATFLEASVYDLPDVLDAEFDIVYASRGVLCWLRDLKKWARIIVRFLRPGGIFYLMESHPVASIFEERLPGELAIVNPYFHKPEPTRWDDDGPDYADETYHPKHPSFEWDWSVSDIINALIEAGLLIEHLGEDDRLFYRRYPGMVECPGRWYRLPQYAGKLPLTFTLKAGKAAPPPC
jgi:SAM-dependent methyltransferase